MAANIDLKNLVGNWQTSSSASKLHWSGSFDEYLALVKSNPKITRNAFQRMYDMIVEAGTEDYTDFKKQVVRYRFFDDSHNNGKDAVSRDVLGKRREDHKGRPHPALTPRQIQSSRDWQH